MAVLVNMLNNRKFYYNRDLIIFIDLLPSLKKQEGFGIWEKANCIHVIEYKRHKKEQFITQRQSKSEKKSNTDINEQYAAALS